MLAGSRTALSAGSYYQMAWVPDDNDDAVNGGSRVNGPSGSIGTDDQGSVARSDDTTHIAALSCLPPNRLQNNKLHSLFLSRNCRIKGSRLSLVCLVNCKIRKKKVL